MQSIHITTLLLLIISIIMYYYFCQRWITQLSEYKHQFILILFPYSVRFFFHCMQWTLWSKWKRKIEFNWHRSLFVGLGLGIYIFSSHHPIPSPIPFSIVYGLYFNFKWFEKLMVEPLVVVEWNCHVIKFLQLQCLPLLCQCQ